MSPRVVIAAPLFNKAGYVEAAVRSLLAQTYRDFALLLIDDRSDDGTTEICRALAAEDERIVLEVNDTRLGMLGNSNRALSLARERFPDAEYWALGSDHDIWLPRWLETVVGLLDSDPDAVLAYTLAVRVDADGEPYGGRPAPWRFETPGVRDPRARLAAAVRWMVAGEMIYGLFRLSALAEIGMLYRPVLIPDRLLLSELALRGTFRQAPEVLWHRRFRGLALLDRQRRVFFLDDVPLYARTPWWAQHTGALLLAYGIRGDFEPQISRAAGVRLAARYLPLALAHRGRRRIARLRRLLKRLRPQKVAYKAVSRTLARIGPQTGAAARHTLERMRANPASRPLAARLEPHFERVAGRLNARGKGNR
jgi:glycosyltransferase involved in cell wall biosynthesis